MGWVRTSVNIDQIQEHPRLKFTGSYKKRLMGHRESINWNALYSES